MGLLLGLIPAIGVVMVYIWQVLSGFHQFDFFDNFIKNLFGGLLATIFAAAASCLVGYAIVFLFRWMGELMRLRAQVANDVRDLGDIHRAATFNVTEEVEPEVVAPETAPVEE